jgi:hypothetical protein
MTTDAEVAERRARLLGPTTGLGNEQIKQYVRETFSRLASTLDSLSGEQATWKPEEGEWSAAQVGDHVALGTGVMGNITGLLAKGQAVTDADWDPPPQFRGSADVGDVKRRLRELPGFTDRLFDEGATTDSLEEKANNSLLGDMNWREWFYFLGVHANDHIGQVEKLGGLRGFRSSAHRARISE